MQRRAHAALFIAGLAGSLLLTSCEQAAPASAHQAIEAGTDERPALDEDAGPPPDEGNQGEGEGETTEPEDGGNGAPVGEGEGEGETQPNDVAPSFGSHIAYVGDGVLLPGGLTAAERDDATAAFYAVWKEQYLKDGCNPREKRIKSKPDTDVFTVSEAHGYGMLITALLAGRDPDAQSMFDDLARYFLAHPSSVDARLMAWAQNLACDDVEGGDSATDGDLDIAYSLLLAHRQWGSDGEVDYLSAAQRLLDGILAAEVSDADVILIGDWASDPSEAYSDGTRSSDWMTSHFRSFGLATGEARWSRVVDKTYAMAFALQRDHAPSTGLLPDFIVAAPSDEPAPAPGDWLEGSEDGAYSYNACRTPMRLAFDHLLFGEPRARDAVRLINAFIRNKTADDPSRIKDGYRLDGTAVGSSAELPFVAGFAVAAMIEPTTGTNQPWLDALWRELETRSPSGYYGDSLKLIAMLALSGNLRAP